MEILYLFLIFTFLVLPTAFLRRITADGELKKSLLFIKWFAIVGYIILIFYSIYTCNSPSVPVEDNIKFIE